MLLAPVNKVSFPYTLKLHLGLEVLNLNNSHGFLSVARVFPHVQLFFVFSGQERKLRTEFDIIDNATIYPFSPFKLTESGMKNKTKRKKVSHASWRFQRGIFGKVTLR